MRPVYTAGQQLTTRRATKLTEQVSESLRENIIDIETSIEVHKEILREVISSKSAAFSLDGSSETDIALLVPGRAFESFMSENKRLESCIEWAGRELQDIRDSILRSEAELTDAKLIEERKSQKIINSIKDLKAKLRKQERHLQSMEAKASSIEKECENASKFDAQIDADSVTMQMKRLIRQLVKQGKASQRSCIEMESQQSAILDHIKGLRRSLKMTTDFSLLNTQGRKDADLLDMNYEGYFFAKNKYQNSDVSDSLSSGEFDSTGLKLPNKVHIQSKQRHRLPKLDLSRLSVSNEESKLDSKMMDKSQVALLELEYINRIKSDEIESYRRLLDYLQVQNTFLAERLVDQPSKQ